MKYKETGENLLDRLEREKRERKFVKTEKKRRKKAGLPTSFFYC